MTYRKYYISDEASKLYLRDLRVYRKARLRKISEFDQVMIADFAPVDASVDASVDDLMLVQDFR